MEYKNTIITPQTAFPMKAGLPQREPGMLQRWQEQGFHSAAEVQSGDRKPVPKGASGELGAAELEAIQRVLREG